MQRRQFLQKTGLATAGFAIAKDMFAHNKGPIYGHNGMRYRMDAKWGQLNPEKFPVNDCHEMVQDKRGRIILLTNETKNNILIYNKSGKLLQLAIFIYRLRAANIGNYFILLVKYGNKAGLFRLQVGRTQYRRI